MNEEKLQNFAQRIAESVLNLWWEHQKRGFSFSHVAQCLPTLAQSSPATVLPIILGRLHDAE